MAGLQLCNGQHAITCREFNVQTEVDYVKEMTKISHRFQIRVHNLWGGNNLPFSQYRDTVWWEMEYVKISWVNIDNYFSAGGHYNYDHFLRPLYDHVMRKNS